MSDMASAQKPGDKRRHVDGCSDRSERSAGTSALPFHLPARLSLSSSVSALEQNKEPSLT